MRIEKNILIKTVLIIVSAALLVMLGVTANCGKGEKVEPGHEGHDHGPGEHDHEAEAETAEVHDAVHVKPEIIKQWNIEYQEAESRDYVEKVQLTGVAKANKSTTYIVNALVGGIVTEMKKDVGEKVNKGDVLCILNSHELLEHKTNYVKAYQEFRSTGENYERARNLFKIKAIEQKQLMDRETTYKTALAEFFSLEAELKSIGFDHQTLKNVKRAVEKGESEKLKQFLSPYYRILAPMTGKVMARNLNLGERVENNTPIFEVSDTRKLWVILDAMEKDLQYIEKGKNVSIETDVYPGKYFPGVVLLLQEKVDPELRTVKVRVEVDNESGLLKPEMYVKGGVEKKIQKQYIAIPESALVKVSSSDGVFVIDGDGFVFKAVKVIDVDSDGFAFVEGIKTGEMVISRGAFYLKAEHEIQSGSADPHAGHNH